MEDLENNLLQSRQDYFQLLTQLVEVTSLDLKDNISLEISWEDAVRNKTELRGFPNSEKIYSAVVEYKKRQFSKEHTWQVDTHMVLPQTKCIDDVTCDITATEPGRSTGMICTQPYGRKDNILNFMEITLSNSFQLLIRCLLL